MPLTRIVFSEIVDDIYEITPRNRDISQIQVKLNFILLKYYTLFNVFKVALRSEIIFGNCKPIENDGK